MAKQHNLQISTIYKFQQFTNFNNLEMTNFKLKNYKFFKNSGK